MLEDRTWVEEVKKQSSGRAGPRTFPDAGDAKPEAVTGSHFTGTEIII